MLSDREREALRELERQFTAGPNAGPLPSHRRQFGASGTLLIASIIFLGVLMLLAGSLTGAVMFGALAWLIWWAWLPPTDDTPHPP